jgi:hypothetical protein
MYVSGETGEPSVETTSIIEDIVRGQVIELVRLPQTFATIGLLLFLTQNPTATKLHRARLTTRLQIHQHK